MCWWAISDGTWLTSFGEFGNADGQFNCVRGLCVDSTGQIWVSDDNKRVQTFVFWP